MKLFTPVRAALFGVGLISLLAAIGCGSSGSVTLPHITGNFSNASLKGTYVYAIHGTSLATGEPYREVGVFTADGSGNITAGIDDFAGGLTSGSSTTVTGSYTVASDGTGFVALGPTQLGNISSSNQITLAITISSSSQVQLIESDFFADAAGVAELQDSTAIAATPTGSFVFRVHQEISGQNSSPASEVGMANVPGSGVNGAMDQNLSTGFTSPNVTLTFGAPSGSGTGTGTLLDAGSGFQTDFIYFIVNSGKVDLLVSNAGAVGGGTAEAQGGGVASGLSGNYAFGSRGDDSNSTSGFFGTLGTVGQFTAGSGTINGTEDSSIDGNITSKVTFSACYTTASNGRVAVTDCSGNLLQVFWMVNSGRAFFVNNTSGSFEDGTADVQTTTSFSTSTLKGQYSLVMDGLDTTPQSLARIGTLQFDGSGKLTLNELANASNSGGGATSPGLLTGTYSVGTNGRITGGVSNSQGGVSLVMYAVSGSSAYALQSDAGTITSGMLQLQQ